MRVRIETKALTVPTVEQVYFEVDRRWKFEALTRLIDLHDVTLAIVFANTQRVVNELTEQLMGAGYTADCIHGGMPQASRDRVMSKFRSGGLRFLVATDVAARGIDVDDIQVVFNFDLPYDAEDYVHRIGRTGRAGRSGIGISFASGREVFVIRDIERFTRQRIRRGEIPSTNEIEDARRDQFLKSLRETLQAGDFRHYDHVIEALLEEGFDSLDVTSAAIHRLISKPSDESSKAAKPAKAPKTLAGAPPTAASPAAVVPPAAVAPASPRAALPSAPARAPALAPKATHTASFEAHLPRKFEPRAVEPVRVDRAKHELPRALKTTTPVPVPFVPPAVPKTSAVIPIAAPASPKPRTPKPAALAPSAPAPTSGTASPTDAVAVTPPLPKTPKAPRLRAFRVPMKLRQLTPSLRLLRRRWALPDCGLAPVRKMEPPSKPCAISSWGPLVSRPPHWAASISASGTALWMSRATGRPPSSRASSAQSSAANASKPK